MTLDSKSEEFLADAKTEGTRETYRVGLQKFADFLQKQGFVEGEHSHRGNMEDLARAGGLNNS
jgi:hypothetical protein